DVAKHAAAGHALAMLRRRKGKHVCRLVDAAPDPVEATDSRVVAQYDGKFSAAARNIAGFGDSAANHLLATGLILPERRFPHDVDFHGRLAREPRSRRRAHSLLSDFGAALS